MTTGEPITMLSLRFFICLLMVNMTHQCLIQEHRAYCSGRSLRKVPPLPFNITHVDLSLNYIPQLNEESFRGLESLVHLDLGSQNFRGLVIKNNTFRGLHNLTFLHLGNNIRLQLETAAFQGLSNLQTLVLLRCDLDERILSGSYLQPLVSLQELNLFGNQIRKLKPAMFFRNMTDLSVVDLSINTMGSICENDLVAFQGKHFHLMKLSTLHLNDMNQFGFNWTACGNPFKNMVFDTLDLTYNGINTDEAKLFFSAIQSTRINHLIFHHNTLGSGFGFNNLKDPDRYTFAPLQWSGITTIDLSDNDINVLKWSVFRSLIDVDRMSLAHNRINQFEKNAFLGLQHLRILNLSSNLIGEIYDHTFDNLHNLILLDLTDNHIGVVQHNSFSGLFNLLALDLTGNSLRTVYKFAQLPNLQELHLNDNKINSLYKLERVARSVTRLRLDSNLLRDMGDVYIILSKFPNIVHLNFSDNFMSNCFHNSSNSIPSSNRLEELHLDRNALRLIWESNVCLDIFDNLHRLKFLYLGYNQLQSLPEGLFKGLTSLHYVDLSYNSLTHLRKDTFPENLKFLDISYNFLSSPDPNVFRFLSMVNLGMNRFLCDCNLRDFQAWANETSVQLVPGLWFLECEFPQELRGVSLANFTADSCEDDDEELLETLRFSLFVGCSAFLTAVTLGSIAYARFRGDAFVLYRKLRAKIIEGQRPEVEDIQHDELQYDVYLCFAEADFVWVESALLERLDSQFAEQNQLRCCFEARDFIPGEDHLTNIRSAIWGSRKTVCVVSKEFLKDGWCLEAFILAQGRMLQELKDVLVMVVVGSVPHFRLMKYEPIRAFVKNREYLQWPEDTQDIEWFFHRLVGKIAKDSKVKQPKGHKDGADIELHAVGQVDP